MIETNVFTIMANEGTVEYSKFDVKHLSFTKLEENSRSKGQMIAYPRYDPTNSGKEGPLFLQSPWIKLYTYGVPRLGEFYKTDADRSHLRVPFDLSIPEVAEFAEKMKSIDAYLGSAECMEKMLGKKAKKYKYQPIYREGQDQTNGESDDEEEDKQKKSKETAPRPPYMKIKLDTTWPDNNIKTQVFNSVLNKDTGKRTRTKVENMNTVDDFANVVRFLSNVRLMFRPVKFWAHGTSKKDPECGVVFKLIKVEVEPNQTSNSMYKQIYDNDNFIDSDGEDEPLPKKLEEPETVFSKATTKAVKKEESDEEESSDDEEPVKSKSTKKVESDDEESDDEVVVQKTQQIAQVDSDSDESSEDDEPVKPKGKGKKAPPAKEVKSKKGK
jgi:hypothetical protein